MQMIDNLCVQKVSVPMQLIDNLCVHKSSGKRQTMQLIDNPCLHRVASTEGRQRGNRAIDCQPVQTQQAMQSIDNLCIDPVLAKGKPCNCD